MKNENIRFIFVYGGSSAGKSYTILQAQTIDTLSNEQNCLAMRKFSTDLSTSIYPDAKAIGERINTITKNFTFQINKIKIRDGQIRFRGLDVSHKLQGIAKFKRIYADEITHFTFGDFKQMRKRLRGRRGQQIIASWNPISANHWIKKEVIDAEEWIDLPTALPGNPHSQLYNEGTINENSFKRINERGNTLLIKTTYRDNWWIVGHPSGKKFGFYDKHVIEDFAHDKIHNPEDYDVYANGQWGTSSERLAFKPSEWTVIDTVPPHAKRIPTGMDFGWNPDPTAVVDFYIYENYLVWDELVYETELNNARQYDANGDEVGKSIEQRLDEKGFNRDQLIIAESQEPKSIEELRVAGFNIHAVKKRPIVEGVKLLKKYHHLITKRSTNVKLEFQNYKKAVDKDDVILNEYVDDHNHCFDLARYLMYMKGFLW